VSSRTLRRWVAEGKVESRRVGDERREARLIRRDTLPPVTGTVSGDDTPDDRGAVTRVVLSRERSTDRGDNTGDVRADATHDGESGRGDSALERLVSAQVEEIAHLRAQLNLRSDELIRRDQAEAELRRLLAQSQQMAAVLAQQLEQRALPPAVEATAPPRRVKWWWPWGR
jgi:hypothetical protein